MVMENSLSEEKYNSVKTQYESTERTWGMVNVYTCKNGHRTWTIDRDNGVTPFMIQCEQNISLTKASLKGPQIRCKAVATSAMYRVHSGYESFATHEFYRPSYAYIVDQISSPPMLEHIANGGLCFRKIGDLHCQGSNALESV